MRDTSLSKRRVALSWILQLIAAGILGQTLFFKFSAAPESVQLFEQLGVEPWGRIASGCVELLAVLLLLRTRTAAIGALLAACVMLGAIGTHLFSLGISVQGDGGALFSLALVTFMASSGVVALRTGSFELRRFSRTEPILD